MQVASHPTDLNDSSARRRTMVDCQIRTFDVTDQRLLARLEVVPRERFVPDERRDLAYSDVGLVTQPSGASEARYLLPPLILARLIQGGRVKPTDKVLDVGCGTGYSTALLAGLAGSVVALESEAALRTDVETRLAGFGLGGIHVHAGDLAEGVAADAPFDVILVGGSVETNLDGLLGQLAEGGRLMTIRCRAGDPTGGAAKALCYEKRGGEIGTRYLFDASAPILRAFRRAPAFEF